MILQREMEIERERYMVRDNYNKLIVIKFRIYYLFNYSLLQKLFVIGKKKNVFKEIKYLIVY